jgi:hypothetical protein
MQIPHEGREWMTEEIRALLEAIPGPHAPKKRTTVIKLAFAHANQQPLRGVFGQPDTCAENIWYMKWRFAPEIKAALEACRKRALEYVDDETAAIEAHYRTQRRRSTAKYAADAPVALAAVMSGGEQRGNDRIRAAMELIGLAEPETRGKLPAFPVEVQNLDDLIEYELARLAGGSESGVAGAVEADASAGDDESVSLDGTEQAHPG